MIKVKINGGYAYSIENNESNTKYEDLNNSIYKAGDEDYIDENKERIISNAEEIKDNTDDNEQSSSISTENEQYGLDGSQTSSISTDNSDSYEFSDYHYDVNYDAVSQHGGYSTGTISDFSDKISYQDIEGIKGFPSHAIKNIKDESFIDSAKSFMGFIKDIRENGVSHAIWGKSFFEVCVDSMKNFSHELLLAIVNNGDIVFLMPMTVILFGTIILGRNKYSKFILPLGFAYFVSEVLTKIM